MWQQIRDSATGIQEPGSIVKLARGQLVETSTKALQIINNLRTEMRPTRQAILSVSGIFAAVGFLVVVAIMFLISSVVAVDLNPTQVLYLGAFFGLVIGFGYGATRFRPWLGDIFSGSAEKAKAATDRNG
jgi:hypothetical protein